MAIDVTKLQALVTAMNTAFERINTALNTRTAADSSKLGGMTLAQLQGLIDAAGGSADQVAQDLADFAARDDNPHGVTAAQVGLGSVVNAGFASTEQAIAGLVADVYASPASIKAFLEAWWAAQIDTTPETLDTINEIAAAITDNVDAITALQSVAAGKETPAGAQAKVDAAVLSLTALIDSKLDATAQAVDSAKLEGKTLAQVVADATAAANLDSKLDATAQAVDSALLEGKSIAQLTASNEEAGTGVSTAKFVTPAALKSVNDAQSAAINGTLDTHNLAIQANATRIGAVETVVDGILEDMAAAFAAGGELFLPAGE